MSEIENNSAERWSLDTMRSIIIDPKSEEQLNDQYNAWSNMTYDQRRESDWKSVEIYGKTNKERYEEMLPKYLKKDIPEPDKDYVVGSVTEQVDYRGYDLNRYLKVYIESTILPEYNRFDPAHNVSHVEKVIQSALYLGKQYDLNLNIVYASAAYHDIGLREDRGNHHIHSYDIVKNDTTLSKWFTPEDIDIIAGACRDHRASSDIPPKTIYGRVIADADKTDGANINDMIKRSYSYNVADNSHKSDDEIFEDVYNHLREKYGKGGYAKLYLPETNKLMETDRKEATKILSSRTSTRDIFNKLTHDINSNNVDGSIKLFGTNVEDYEYFKKIDNNKAISDHGHSKILPDKVEFAFHNNHNFKWSNKYKHCSDSSDNKEYEILHYKEKHIINQPYAMGHGLGKTENEREAWYNFTQEVEGQKGWFCMDSGKKVDEKDVPKESKELMIKWHQSQYHKNRTFSEQVEDDMIEFKNIKYPIEAIEKAEIWALNSMRTIIRPRDTLQELESDWLAFNTMSIKYRRQTDSKSIELFGVDNKTHLEFLKSKFLKMNIDTDLSSDEYNGGDNVNSHLAVESLCYNLKHSTDSIDAIKYALELTNIKNRTFSENILIQNTLNDPLELFKNNICDIESSEILSNDLPFYSPDELISFGIYSGENNLFHPIPDNDCIGDDIRSNKWFDNYRMMYNGVRTEDTNKYTSLWVNKLNELYYDYKEIKESKDADKINARRQSIIELGWDPYLEFTIPNRMKAKNRVISLLKESYKDTTIIDLEGFMENHEIIVSETVADNPLMVPIYIVFIKSNTIFNKIVTSVTKGEFGHVSIGFDASLKNLHSYSVNAGGFAHESIDRYKDVSKLKVYAMFIKKSSADRIKKSIKGYSSIEDKTDYSFVNLLTMPLKIQYKSDTNMVCSQFVDSMLKLGDIDLTKADSSLVDPQKLYSKIVRNKKLYKIYDGDIAKYNADKVKSFISSITNKLYSVKEFSQITNESSALQAMSENVNNLSKLQYLIENSNIVINEDYKRIYDVMLSPYVNIQPIRETNEFPMQFDEDGNLLIKKMDSLDFEHEYSKSHKLLLVYEKNDNIEGIKYELCKLWFMNLILEKKLYSNPNNKDIHNKARAKILNDFNKYLNLVVSKDNTFNFIEYYDNTPFNDTKIKIRSSTLKYTMSYIKSILL